MLLRLTRCARVRDLRLTLPPRLHAGPDLRLRPGLSLGLHGGADLRLCRSPGLRLRRGADLRLRGGLVHHLARCVRPTVAVACKSDAAECRRRDRASPCDREATHLSPHLITSLSLTRSRGTTSYRLKQIRSLRRNCKRLPQPRGTCTAERVLPGGERHLPGDSADERRTGRLLHAGPCETEAVGLRAVADGDRGVPHLEPRPRGECEGRARPERRCELRRRCRGRRSRQ